MNCNGDCLRCTLDLSLCPLELEPEDDFSMLTAEDYRGAAVKAALDTRTPRQKAIAAKKREYYEANRDAIAAKKREYYEANRDAIAAKKREYYEANRDAIAAKKREYREANRESIAAKKREYREANREAIAAKQREYREANREAIAAKQKKIKDARKARGYTQRHLARLVGVSHQAISFWERGEIPAPWDKLIPVLPELAEVAAS